MLNKKTVIVIGAGSGYDIGMPMGTKLAESIASTTEIPIHQNKRSPNNPIYSEMLRKHARTVGSVHLNHEIVEYDRASNTIST
ncbi:hypothetical protein, partial [Methylobacterium frigidaeris]